MGHSSTRAALIYLHATRERDQAIAAGMGKLLKDAKKGTRPYAQQTARHLGGVGDHPGQVRQQPLQADLVLA